MLASEGAIAQSFTLPPVSTSADDLPTLSNNEQGLDYLNDGIQSDRVFQDALGQQTGASQFGDVTPEEWAYQALNELVSRYDCLAGYPDGTYRGDRPLSRDELAAALNACLQNIERILLDAAYPQEDWDLVRAFPQEFSASLNALKERIDRLEGRVAFLENHQFSLTTKFNGEVMFAFSDLAIEQSPRNLSRGTVNGVEAVGITDNDDANPVFGARGRLWLRTSFTGEDVLLIRATTSNLAMFEDANELSGKGFPNGTILTGETTQTFNLGFNTATFETNNLTVSYSLPVNDAIHAHIFANGGLWTDFVPTLNPYFDDGDNGNGALSLFASNNPIYRIGGGAGVGFNVNLGELSDFLTGSTLSVGYLSGPQSTKNPGGIFSGDYAVLAQVDFELSDRLAVGLTYNHAYHPSATAVFDMGGLGSQGVVGSALANIAASAASTPRLTHGYGVELSWQPSDWLALNGFFSYIDAQSVAVQTGDYEIWTYGLGVALLDLGKEDAVLGLFAGTQPYVAGFDGSGVTVRNDVRNHHIEVFYRYPLTDYLSITPGAIFFTNPNQIREGASIYTLRATFSF